MFVGACPKTNTNGYLYSDGMNPFSFPFFQFPHHHISKAHTLS